jgi:phosphonate ABC transporter permease subunit PhnE
MSEISAQRAGKNLLRTILLILAILGIFLLFAGAVQVTNFDLEKPLEPTRQENLIRVLRLLADPDIFATDKVTGEIIWTQLSEAGQTTVERIIETIFMALIASLVGTALAVPISFLAARNIMENVSAELAAIGAALVALPIGGWLGLQITALIGGQAADLSTSLVLDLVLLLLTVGLFYLVSQVGSPLFSEEQASIGQRILSAIRLLIALGLLIFGLALLAQIGLVSGKWLEQNLGPFGFLGNFIFVLSDLLRLLLPALVALMSATVLASSASRYAQEAVLSWPNMPARILTAVAAALGTAVVVFAIASFLSWLYQPDDPNSWTTIPAMIGAGLGVLLSVLVKPRQALPIGSIIYTITRTILNVLRSIEPLIMGIVFVVWVSLGPFAGIMALTLHSIAALGKLFSEQVEGIDEGPVEAIIATGASRLQMVIFAVIPQIIPPYTAFALYRWDINVRLSTIIGFVGGGGIGFVLSQNIRQLRYRQASVMMLAIAIVIVLLDYASSKIRQRII